VPGEASESLPGALFGVDRGGHGREAIESPIETPRDDRIDDDGVEQVNR
jgi:hypothetical protein